MPQNRENKMFNRTLKPKQAVPTREHGDSMRLIPSRQIKGGTPPTESWSMSLPLN